MENCVLPAVVLPDIEMYGGDTQPWEISIKHENGISYTTAEMTGYDCVLTITPFSVNTISASVPLVLIKSGRLGANDDGGATIMFEFNSADTIRLRGKFVYQIAFSYNSTKLRVGQGKLTIRPNNHTGG